MKERKKYPRTYHLNFSKGINSDDKIIKSTSSFEGQEVVVTLKMDGENTSIYPDNYTHARSIDSKTNWTRDIVKKISSVISSDIPEGYRLCCENLYAKHAIYYPDGYLDGYLYLLSVWNEKNECLSWDDTVEFAELLDLPQPKVIYRGIFDEKKLKELANNLDIDIEEGFVVRLTKSFPYEDFSKSVTKYVRSNHVQVDAEHWIVNATPNGVPKQPCKPLFMSQTEKGVAKYNEVELDKVIVEPTMMKKIKV